MRSVIYARYSTDRQEESSITDQVRRCRDYAAARGWEVVEVFADEGISGAALGNRPGVQKALELVSAGHVLLVVDTSRLSRSQDLAPLVTRLRHREVRVIGVLDGFDSYSPTARMHAGLSGIMSEEYRAQVSSRTHSALDMRAREGRPTGGKCYGFTNTGQVVESEAAVVREVFARAAAGDSQKAIASDLNVRGIPSPGASWDRRQRTADGFWRVSAINSMLGNERYIGRVVWNRSQFLRDPDTGKRKRIERPESEWIISEGPEIVDHATWSRVRGLPRPRHLHGGNRGGGPKYLLSGVLKCGVCSGHLIATGSGGAYYYCATRRQAGNVGCSNHIGARRDVAEELLLAPILTGLLSPDAVAHAMDYIARCQREEGAATLGKSATVSEIESRIAKLEAQMAAGILDREDIGPSLAALHERRRIAEASAKRKAVGGVWDQKAAEAAYRAAVADMREVLTEGPFIQAREALHELLGPVECKPEGDHLVAMVGLNIVPLLKAAGFAQIGSGGRI